MTDFLPLEKAVMLKLLAGDHPVLAQLRRQFASARVADRDFTGVGVFLTFLVNPALALSPAVDFPFGDIHALIPGMEHGLGFVLFICGGLIDTLEGYAYAEPWPKDTAEFRLQYVIDGHPSNERDLEALHKVLPNLVDSPKRV